MGGEYVHLSAAGTFKPHQYIIILAKCSPSKAPCQAVQDLTVKVDALTTAYKDLTDKVDALTVANKNLQDNFQDLEYLQMVSRYDNILADCISCAYSEVLKKVREASKEKIYSCM